MNGLNFHDEMVAKISNKSDLGRVYTQSYNDWLDKHDAEIRADERKKVLNEVIEKIKSGEYCSSSTCKHYYEISDHFVDGDCTEECEDPIIEMIEQMKGESK